jgi:hypothetical protein
MNYAGVISVGVVALCVLLIPILIGMDVYKDAKARNMDAVLWTLVAILVPSFIGLIIYLVIRTNNMGLNCPNCKKPVAPEYALCPYCGTALKAVCPNCSAPIERGWKVCARCGADLPETAGDVAAYAAPKKDRKLLVILAVVIAIPVLIFILNLAVFDKMNTRTSSLMTAFAIPLDNGSTPEYVNNWVRDCDAQGPDVYVLKLSPEFARSNDKLIRASGDEPIYREDAFTIYVYVNLYKDGDSGKWIDNWRLDHSRGTLEIDYLTVTGAPEKAEPYQLSHVSAAGDGIDSVEIFIDGQATGFVMTEYE